VDSTRPELINLTTIDHPSGTITVAEEGTHSPFAFRRAYFLHGLNPSSQRGAHGHRKLRQLMIAVSGSFRVWLSGSFGEETYELEDPNRGLLIPPMTWRDLDSFSPGAICLVLASDPYEEADYIRDYEEFVKLSELQG